jgi:hypothetical protein
MCPEESANDGFMVPDGQLSDDEGLSSVQQDIDTMCADHEGAPLTVSSPLPCPMTTGSNCRFKKPREGTRRLFPDQFSPIFRLHRYFFLFLRPQPPLQFTATSPRGWGSSFRWYHQPRRDQECSLAQLFRKSQVWTISFEGLSRIMKKCRMKSFFGT